jgi:hypothetical protein
MWHAPLRLYHCSGDLHISPDNTQVALEALTDNGADVVFFDPNPGADHISCAPPALFAVCDWFDSLR